MGVHANMGDVVADPFEDDEAAVSTPTLARRFSSASANCCSFEIGTPPDPEECEEWEDDAEQEEKLSRDPWAARGSWEGKDMMGTAFLAKLDEDDEPTTDFYICTPPPELEDDGTGSPSAPKDEHGVSRKTRERRRLCDVIWACLRALAIPDGPRRLLFAERRLAKLGIASVQKLHAHLSNSKSDLRRRLIELGERPFCQADIRELHLQAAKALEPAKDDASPANRIRWHVGDGTAEGEQAAQKRSLWDLLWMARPLWLPHDLVAAEHKLASVGIHDPASLDRALAVGLNVQLRSAGLKTFSVETVVALQRCLDEAYGRELQEVQKEDAWMLSGNYDSGLCDVLWECRPDWSAQDLQRAVRKLKIVGITSATTLAAALARGLNKELREAGLKPFSPDTIRELKQRLGVPMHRRKKPSKAADGGTVAPPASGAAATVAAAAAALADLSVAQSAATAATAAGP